MKELTTKRLLLRLPQAADKHTLVEHLSDFDVVKWLSNIPTPYTESDAVEWIELVSRNLRDEKPGLQPSIFMDEALIGGVGLRHVDDDVYELGYWLTKSHWGQGLATEAARELIRYGQEHLTHPRIIAHCMKGNAASQSVLKKLGFAVIDDVEIYSMPRQRLMPSLKLSLL
jgi:RimJ/RimL family protein N-acetyltransferase